MPPPQWTPAPPRHIQRRPPSHRTDAALADTRPLSLEHAVAALAQGDLSAALAAASDACHTDPDRAEPHYVYGQVWLAMNRPDRAQPAFGTAIRLAPDWPDAWINFGLARYRQGAIDDAKLAMREALAREPGHPIALANLGAFIRISGLPGEAEALLRETLRREPGNIGARLNLAADLLQEERSQDALALLTEADPPAGDSPSARHWLLQLSLALLQLGQADAVELILARLEALGPVPPEVAPLVHWRRTLLALLRGDRAAAHLRARLMETALGAMGAEAVLEHEIMARFDLAKFWSGQGDHAAAFRLWTQGHRLLARTQPFSRTDFARFVDDTIRLLDTNHFVTRPRAANRDPAPVFIVGMPRSGTTLCEQILAAHRDVHGAGERDSLARAFADLAGLRYDPGAVARIAALDQPTLDTAATAYLAELHALAPGKARIVDKMPLNALDLGLVGRMLPGARIIHTIRDPRDTGLSIFTFRFYGSHPYAHDLADLGWTIAQVSRLMDHWKAALSNPILTIRLSDWVTDFEATLDRVLAFLDLSPDPNCARFHEAETPVRTVSRDQVRQPVNARGLGRWKTYEAELRPIIAELEAAGVLEEWD